MREGLLPQDIIDQVREAADLVEVASAHLALTRAGKNYMALCPFHAEKTPSFSISPTRQMFHCFGCGAGGNVFHFLQRLEGLAFPEAVRVLAKRAGIALPTSHGPRSSRDELRDTLLGANAAAAEYFHRVLREDPQAEAARRYVEARGLTAKTVQEFELGYATPAWDGLLRELTRRGWTPAVLEQAGLVRRRDQGGYYDQFRDRLIFPIHDLQGRVIGFGGRLLEPGEPKYLNSPETPLYQKGRNLYAFERAKGPISRAGAALVLVEGYMDALMAHQAGVTHVAATLGTALTAAHLVLVKRFTHRLIVVFDPDPAGVAAVLKLLPLAIESGLTVETVSLSGGEDPDECIRRHGREAFVDLLKTGAVGLLDFALQQAVREIRPDRVEDKVQITSRFLPYLMQLKSRIEQDHYFRRLSEVLRVDETTLRAEARRWGPGPAPVAREESRQPTPDAAPLTDPGPKEEELLLHLLVHGQTDPPSLGLRPEAFTDSRFQRVASRLFQVYAAEGRIDVTRLLSHEEDTEVVRILSALSLQEPSYEDPDRVLRDCRLAMQQKRARRERSALQEQLRAAEQEKDDSRILALQRELIRTQRDAVAP